MTIDPQESRNPGAAREFDLVVLGATGVTGRCVLRRFAATRAADTGPAAAAGGLRWAAAGRDGDRVRAAASEAGVPDAAVVVVDLQDPPALQAMAARTRLVVNLAGPYTRTAEQVIAACITAGTSYVDLSGELPLISRVNRRFDLAAKAAGIQIVQMAGWEAMPADVTTLVACSRAAGSAGGIGPDGPGAGGPVHAVTVSISFHRTPEGRPGIGGSVSGGTVASIVEQLREGDARSVGDPACLLPPSGAAAAVRSSSPLRVRPHVQAGRVLSPAVPVPFLDPPTVHRTAAILAEENGAEHRPAIFREGIDSGSSKGPGALPVLVRAGIASALQRVVILTARSPALLRRGAAAGIGRVAPAAGTGPTGHQLTDWRWEVRADAVTSAGGTGTATLSGTGHPGYTATAGIVLAVAGALLRADPAQRRTGCITPALALGVEGAEALALPELALR